MTKNVLCEAVSIIQDKGTKIQKLSRLYKLDSQMFKQYLCAMEFKVVCEYLLENGTYTDTINYSGFKYQDIYGLVENLYANIQVLIVKEYENYKNHVAFKNICCDEKLTIVQKCPRCIV